MSYLPVFSMRKFLLLHSDEVKHHCTSQCWCSLCISQEADCAAPGFTWYQTFNVQVHKQDLYGRSSQANFTVYTNKAIGSCCCCSIACFMLHTVVICGFFIDIITRRCRVLESLLHQAITQLVRLKILF